MSGGKASGSAKARGIVERDGGKKLLRRLTIYLPPELAQRLAVRAAETGDDMSAIVAEALSRSL